ncbi:hypothetical protein [Williamsia deligens]|uniref:Integral membrane protein n=1 Tax=Williamsia deligens TaxID=321325 RepID=A0ABW3G410_9NOCA|nr:hypothetical protein [Williamsia deligens]MCP2193875.1 hypothetical protein [Williamsia deligens]
MQTTRWTVLGVAIAAVPAGLFLTAPSRGSQIVGLTAEPPGFPWGSSTTASAWGLLAALAVCVGARRVADALFVGAVAAITLLVITIGSAPPALLIAVAAGALLGAVLQLSQAHPGRGTVVVAVIGATIGIVVAPQLARFRAGESGGNRPYADYIPSSGIMADTTVVDLGAGVLAVLAMILLTIGCAPAWRQQIEGAPRTAVVTTSVIVVGCALTHWWLLRYISESLRDTETSGLHTFYGGYVVVGLALVAAIVHPGAARLLWVAAAAGSVALATDGSTGSGTDLAAVTAALVVVAAVVTAIVLRRSPADERTRGVPIAVAVLTAFAATQFITDELWSVIPILVGPFGVPVVLAMAITAATVSIDVDQATVVGGVALLALLRPSTGTDFGWTAYTPLSDGIGFDGISSSPESPAQTAVALVALVACFAAAVSLSRRANPGQ